MGDQGADIRATGRIDCIWKSPDGRTHRYSLIQFNLETQYDSRNRVWRSGGDAVSDNRQYHKIQLGYDESRRILTINVNGYLFTADQTQAMASKYGDRATLNIKFLRDTEGSNAEGDHFTIKGNSRLDISL
jgi:hypothetical protein